MLLLLAVRSVARQASSSYGLVSVFVQDGLNALFVPRGWLCFAAVTVWAPRSPTAAQAVNRRVAAQLSEARGVYTSCVVATDTLV